MGQVSNSTTCGQFETKLTFHKCLYILSNVSFPHLHFSCSCLSYRNIEGKKGLLVIIIISNQEPRTIVFKGWNKYCNQRKKFPLWEWSGGGVRTHPSILHTFLFHIYGWKLFLIGHILLVGTDAYSTTPPTSWNSLKLDKYSGNCGKLRQAISEILADTHIHLTSVG